eukprot:scaffold261354_cov18-Tisochrysis_lutea.AAC.1
MASVDLSFLSQDRRCANWDCASKCKLDWRDTKPGGPSLTTGAVPIIARLAHLVAGCLTIQLDSL